MKYEKPSVLRQRIIGLMTHPSPGLILCGDGYLIIHDYCVPRGA
jgi:hypothetical protein